ncbi:hypothetical protein [Pseudoalteromonas ruthenica]|uniref:hypothetical protein n=1 Tax=Pseudoalteromonas ruthenica TaxID=151081 RepID=UPI0003B2F5A9|nr:hypothetical protein [Pseudoalteromonas ruthenica]
MKLIEDSDIIQQLSEHLNSLLSVADFDRKNDESASPSFNFKSDDPFFLPIDEPLKEIIYRSSYKQLVCELIKRIQIPESCVDIFRSEFDDELVMIFLVSLKDLTQVVTVEEHEKGYIVHCPIMISDLIMPVLSRLHSEVTYTFGEFSSCIEAVGGNTSSLFLNAKGYNAVSQFVQMFVADELGMPDRPVYQNSVVL